MYSVTYGSLNHFRHDAIVSKAAMDRAKGGFDSEMRRRVAEHMAHFIAEKCITLSYDEKLMQYHYCASLYAFSQEELEELLAKTYAQGVEEGRRFFGG